MSNLFQASAHDLWLAAKRVWILNARAIEMRASDFASGQQFTIHGCTVDLRLMVSDFVNAGVEWRVTPFGGVDRHGAGQNCRAKDHFGFAKCCQCECRRNLRAVNQTEALFGSQLQRAISSQLCRCLSSGISSLTFASVL